MIDVRKAIDDVRKRRDDNTETQASPEQVTGDNMPGYVRPEDEDDSKKAG